MFEPKSLILSLIFGVVGLIALRQGKANGNVVLALFGFALLVYPYFIAGWILNLAIGSLLTFVVWKLWNS